jgi:exosortase B
MDASLVPRGGLAGRDNQWLIWLPVLIGLSALYIPTYVSLARTLWNEETNAHGPIVLLVLVWLIWRNRSAFEFEQKNGVVPAISGWALLFAGLVFYALGRSQGIPIFEVGSHIPVLTGAALILLPARNVRRLAFPLLFLIFLVPLPGIIVDPLTASLKQFVSAAAETILYTLGYPIARNGVVLTIGPYRLLVADACSGLNSMYSLSALGLIYLYLARYKSWSRNLIILASILPIAFAANMVRVIVLAMVTYHFGDAAGQGFLHNFAGIVLFVTALISLFAVDRLLGSAMANHMSRNSPV